MLQRTIYWDTALRVLRSEIFIAFSCFHKNCHILRGEADQFAASPKGEFSKAFTYVQRKQMALTLLAYVYTPRSRTYNVNEY